MFYSCSSKKGTSKEWNGEGQYGSIQCMPSVCSRLKYSFWNVYTNMNTESWKRPWQLIQLKIQRRKGDYPKK